MTPIRVLHLASFAGNIGDNANHAGFRLRLQAAFEQPLHYTELEIREFFWKQRKFDASFADLCNQHDMVIIGGGNFFELWVESSATGTSIDISSDILQRIKTPMLFNALGCDPHMGAPMACVERFRAFLDVLLASPQFLVSLRNDGALTNMAKYVGESYAQQVLQVPDGGFFFEPHPCEHVEIPIGKKAVSINLAGDMLDLRFPGVNGNISSDEFFTAFASFATDFLQNNNTAHLVFVPHIYKDLVPINAVLARMPDYLVRKRLSVAALIQHDAGAQYSFSIYKQSAVVLGMRFHANVCPLGFLRPTVGLVSYPQIQGLYRDVGMLQSCLWVNQLGFEQKLQSLVQQKYDFCEEADANLFALKETLKQQQNAYCQRIATWFRGNSA
jgi:polysaccharide pyruvyl transferase WcaK-like protein